MQTRSINLVSYKSKLLPFQVPSPTRGIFAPLFNVIYSDILNIKDFDTLTELFRTCMVQFSKNPKVRLTILYTARWPTERLVLSLTHFLMICRINGDNYTIFLFFVRFIIGNKILNFIIIINRSIKMCQKQILGHQIFSIGPNSELWFDFFDAEQSVWTNYPV